jgi:hypothetical protein
MAQSSSSQLTSLLGNAPAETKRGADGSLFLAMGDLGPNPPSGRLLRGLTPWLDSQGVRSVFLFAERKWREPWSETVQGYQELVHWLRDAQGGAYRGAAWRGSKLKQEELAEVFQREPSALIDYAARQAGAAVISNREPMRLGVQHIPKPWGREGWYTGIEKRGLSRVVSATGQTDLPYALGMFPWPLLREQEGRAPILLKTLEPHPDEVLGDLYLEVHEKKWETYVVLEVDGQAWPEGVGCLRAGLDPGQVERYQAQHGERWRDAIVRELRQRIGAYEQARRTIDGILDARLRERGEDPAQPVPPALQRELLAALPASPREQERRARAEVEAMLGRIPLRVGDAVALPPGVLHSLQHGVKVVEFQTPSYERMIAMFTQKVLTQSHWDTERALARMDKAPFALTPPTPVLDEEGLVVERIVSYPEFTVDRVRLASGRLRAMESEDRYRLVFVAQGSGRIRLADGGELPLAKEDALLLPATLGAFEIGGANGSPLVYLDAVPTRPEASS